MIDDLFELAQLDSGYLKLDYEWIDLSDLISDTLESFAARADAQGVTLEGTVDPGIDLVWAAPEKLSRILDNLLSNALRYTSRGEGRFYSRQNSLDQLCGCRCATPAAASSPRICPIYLTVSTGEKKAGPG